MITTKDYVVSDAYMTSMRNSRRLEVNENPNQRKPKWKTVLGNIYLFIVI